MSFLSADEIDEKIGAKKLFKFMRRGCNQIVTGKEEGNKKELCKRAAALNLTERDLDDWLDDESTQLARFWQPQPQQPQHPQQEQDQDSVSEGEDEKSEGDDDGGQDTNGEEIDETDLPIDDENYFAAFLAWVQNEDAEQYNTGDHLLFEPNSPFDGDHFDGNLLDGKLFDDNHFDDNPFDDNPFDDNPFDDNPFDDNPVDDNPVDDNPFDDNPFDGNQAAGTSSSSLSAYPHPTPGHLTDEQIQLIREAELAWSNRMLEMMAAGMKVTFETSIWEDTWVRLGELRTEAVKTNPEEFYELMLGRGWRQRGI